MNTKVWLVGKCRLERIKTSWVGRWIGVMLVGWLFHHDLCAAPKKVLFYGPTFQPGGVGESLVNASPEFYPIGSGSEVWNPGDPVASKDWLLQSTAAFAAFDAIVIGDLASPNNGADWEAAILSRSIWGPAVNGNVIIFGGDPENHAQSSMSSAGATAIIQNGIRYAADVGASHTTGLLITLSHAGATEGSPVDPGKLGLRMDLCGCKEAVSFGRS
ncbi:MAG: hypothetical protein JNL10_09635 [Verrucomicrobiales bacterium]|nr:hypothetical protein [Verrucomicrobiales bacterium]